VTPLDFQATLSHPLDRQRLKDASWALIEAVRGVKRSAGRIELIGLVKTLLFMASVSGPGPSATATRLSIG
jgi:hypothetical protein